MQIIGLLGGMSWESTALYYSLINRRVREQLGGLHSARLVLNSLDFAEVASLQRTRDWIGATALLTNAAQSLEAGGAEFLLLCTNTMHIIADELQMQLRIPVHHIIDATAQEIARQGLQKVGLLGTQFSMEAPFYTGRLRDHFGLDVIVPDESERASVHRIIYEELCRGEVLADSRTTYLRVIEQLVRQGAEGIILGCTEIGMLVSAGDFSVPCFDTTRIHAHSAVDRALGELPAKTRGVDESAACSGRLQD
jgi:aspartate racemase